MNLTEEQKAEITELAKLPSLSAEEIAIIMGFEDIMWFVMQSSLKGSDVYLAYQRGRLMTKAELSKKIKQLSDQGSGPAQTLLAKMIKDQEYKEILNSYYEITKD